MAAYSHQYDAADTTRPLPHLTVIFVVEEEAFKAAHRAQYEREGAGVPTSDSRHWTK